MSRCCRSQRRRNSWATSAKTSCVLGGVEGDDADRVAVLLREQIFQVGALYVGFRPDAAETPEILHHLVDGLIVAARHDRGRPIGLTDYSNSHATEPGLKAATTG
jgi:hypothetical protein